MWQQSTNYVCDQLGRYNAYPLEITYNDIAINNAYNVYFRSNIRGSREPRVDFNGGCLE